MKLYVGNLSYSSTADTLKAAFAQYGEVATATIITDKFSGRSKGFGFVEMNSDDEARAAIAALDNAELDGRQIKVSEARPMEDRPRRSFGGGNGGSRGGFGGGRRDY